MTIDIISSEEMITFLEIMGNLAKDQSVGSGGGIEANTLCHCTVPTVHPTHTPLGFGRDAQHRESGGCLWREVHLMKKKDTNEIFSVASDPS